MIDSVDKEIRRQGDKENGGGRQVSLSPGLPLSLSRRSWLKWLLIGIVVAYVTVLIVVPLGALVAGAFGGGLGAIATALSEPDVLSAFGRTLLIAVIVVLVHAICGTAVA